MWLFVLFDLPVTTRKARKDYATFRKELIKEGFSMLQFSVYARYFNGEDSCQTKRNKIQMLLPPDGQVRLLTVTDHQFGKMQVFYGKIPQDAEQKDERLLLF